jgi:hypothetical protein
MIGSEEITAADLQRSYYLSPALCPRIFGIEEHLEPA